MKIAFFDNSTALKTVHDLKSGARGGMISSLFAVSDGLSLLGHDVTVLSDIKQVGTTKASVYWGSSEEVGDSVCDILVCNRGISPDGFAGAKAKHRILWTHDLPHIGLVQNPKILNAFDRVVFMSLYAEDVWRTFFPSIRKSVIIPNGVDKSIFYPRKKDYDYIIYGSAPNRGIQYLDLIITALQSRVRTSLYLKTYSNIHILHPKETMHRETQMIADLPFKNESVMKYDPLPQSQWAEELGKAGLMVIPTAYPEICSNVVLQSLASGTPIVTTGNLGSTSEWVISGYNGFTTKYLPNDYMVHPVELIRFSEKLLSSRRDHNRFIKNAARTKNILTWQEVAKHWDKMMRKL